MELSIIPGKGLESVIHNIIDNIYIGNFQSHIDFDGVIINLSDYDYQHNNDIKRIIISDSRSENISHYFDECVDFVNKSNTRILIHCNEGVSRSVSILLAILVKKYNMSLYDAIMLVKSKRNHPTKPNIGFFKQLIKYEKEIKGESSILLDKYKEITY